MEWSFFGGGMRLPPIFAVRGRVWGGKASSSDSSVAFWMRRYSHFMEDVAQLIAVEYGGSLKGEHGTGRNMAPFVEVCVGGYM